MLEQDPQFNKTHNWIITLISISRCEIVFGIGSKAKGVIINLQIISWLRLTYSICFVNWLLKRSPR